MAELPIVLLSLSLLPYSHTFNVDEGNPISVKGPSVNDLFGYSLALDPAGRTLYAGAPAYQGNGAVFRCDFDPRNAAKKSECKAIKDDRSPAGNSQQRNRDFMGASLVMDNSTLFACAPRTRADKYERLESTTGNCFSMKQQGQLSKYFTMENPNGRDGWAFFTMMGHSLVMDKGRKHIIIGAPLATAKGLNWDVERHPGHFFMVDKADSAKNFMTYPDVDQVPWGSNTRSTADEPHTYDLIGSAITRGRFFADGDNDRGGGGDHYALGAPKANKLRGRVYLCPSCFSPKWGSSGSSGRLHIDGDQFGSRFGETVCAVDIDGDSFDDLVIGAPLFSQPGGGASDVGAVYLYRAKVDEYRTEMSPVRIVLRHEVRGGARFGAAIANLGDLDGDKCEDFAVGAPFEDSGAVYIYRGSPNFLFNEEPQKLTPASLGLNLGRGFGFSISQQAIDTDRNGRPDFAIGSLQSDSAVVLRAREVVRIFPESSQQTPFNAINPTENEFRLNITTKLRAPVTKNLEVRISFINLDERIKLPNDFDKADAAKTVTLAAGSRSVNTKLVIKSNKPNFDVNQEDLDELPSPLKFFVVVEWNLPCVPEKGSNLACPLMDPRSRTNETLIFSVPLQSGCRNSDFCQCNLEVLPTRAESTRLVVGMDKTITTKLRVKNSGSEPSYDAVLKIASHWDLPLPNDLECVKDTGKESAQFYQRCRLPSLKPNTLAKEFLVSFDIHSWSSSLDLSTVGIRMTLESHCASSTQSSNNNMETTSSVSFDYRSQLEVSSRKDASSKQLSYKNRTDVTFKHEFRIRNTGPSPVKDKKYRILVPSTNVLTAKVLNKEEECIQKTTGRVSTGIQDQTSPAGVELVSCDTYNCMLYECSVRNGLHKDDEVIVAVELTFLASKAARDVSRYTVVTAVQELSTANGAHVATELYAAEVSALAQAVTKYWPYGLGIAIGILLLAALVAALWKTKAFSKMRIFKNQLEDAQKGSAAAAAAPAAEGQ